MPQTPACSEHADREGIIIVSFLDPSVEQPTQVLCEECAPAMAATILQALTGRDVMEWLFQPIPPEAIAENDDDVNPKRAPKATRTRKPKASTNGHSPPATDAAPTDTESDDTTAHDEAVVASTVE